ncbi:hypothetical protein NIES2100_73380 [Calothrix sp. NIES-2100]|uniref:hypothetical protein n=1 Tax=Calothrix sp. NIES-2100 TaxID=1954172 RepID=UPI000B5F88AB|nr:hypothetical protein NIES2100_73380 [Calothrix sp. NIES-2100]
MSSLKIHRREVEIYEFSRGFTEVFENNRWISGGFGNAIDRSNYDGEIPSSIQEFINNNQNIFGIPTGFAPAQGEEALIARVIGDRYCVLAVANYQGKDNKGRDGIVGYRYFWLDKNSKTNQKLSSMDGVVTLLNWWLKNRFVFQMNPDSFTRKKLVCREYIEDTDSYHPHNQQNYPIKPAILTLADYKRKNLIHLHTQAAQEAKNRRLPLAWAWNVRKLNFPAMYVAIWCENEAAKQTIERELARNDVPDGVNPLPNQRIQRADRGSLTVNEKSIEMKLDEFISASDKNITEKARAIVKILCHEENLDWRKFFVADNQHIKDIEDAYPPIEAVRYYALMPIFIPEKIIEWLDWLRKNQKHIKISFQTQIFLIKECRKQQTELINQRLYDGISTLLDELVNSETNNYEKCKWLLVKQKHNIWAKKINQYVIDFLIYLERKYTDPSITEEFGGKITQNVFSKLATLFMNYQQQQTENNNWDHLTWWKGTSNNVGLSNLANLLQEKVKAEINPVKQFLHQYNEQLLDVNFLSAICYQYSEGSIPFSVFLKLKPNHKERIQTILKGEKPQERGYSFRIWRNRLIVIIFLISMPTVLLQIGSNLSIYLFDYWTGSSKLSLKESIEKCKNIDANTTKSSESKKQLQKCELELKNILIREINTLNRLKKKEISDDEKSRLRNSKTYSDIENLFINSRVDVQLKATNNSQIIDQYVLIILDYLKQSLEEKKLYIEIFKPLENCANKKEIKEFGDCVQILDNK